MYELEVGIPLRESVSELSQKVLALVGRECVQSGAGFGMRDMTFEFETKSDAVAARARVMAAYPEADCGIEEMA